MFQQLVKLPQDKIKKIGPIRVCFDPKFMIGEGRDGTCVYIGLLDDGKEVAVKRILTHTIDDLDENEKKLREMIEMQKSEYIVRYCDWERDNPFSYLAVELCEETLAEYVKSRDQEELRHKAPVLIREMLYGLRALHGDGKEARILHMDLKPWNVLVDVDCHLRLADYGILRKLDTNATMHTEGKGSQYWRAAEAVPIDEKPEEEVIYTSKSDIQVVGMLSYYILTKGGNAYGVEYNRVRNLIDGKPVALDELPDESAKKLIAWMLQRKIDDRPGIEEALRHPYLQVSQ